MINRHIHQCLENTIKNSPAVALLGPRQVGKTTLARLVGEQKRSVYLDLESPTDLVKLDDPVAYLSSHSDKLVILDEIQRKPDLFLVLRGLVDQSRSLGRQGGQFLLLGSASMDLMRQSSESLAGRIHYLEMSGLNALETQNLKNMRLDKLWLRGGFPKSFLAASQTASTDWLEMLIRTYLERDVPQMGFRLPAARLRRLWTMVAHVQGEPLNCSKLGGNLDLDSKTVASYLDILTDLLLVRRLMPWHTNVKKRLVKSPRFYIRDSGILHRLLNITDFNSLLSHPVLGKSFEGFVIENICSVLPSTVQPYFYKTSAGAEIDLVLQFAHNEIWAIEIKNSTSPKIKPGFYSGCEDIKATRRFVVYSGREQFPMAHNVEVMSLPIFMQELVSR